MPNYANPFGENPNDNPTPPAGGFPGPYTNPYGGNPNSTSPGGIDPGFYYNQVPLAGWYQWLYGINPGLTGTGPEARFAQNQFSRYQGQYQADAAKDPMLQWYDWLNKRSINPSQEFQMQSPEERGDFTSRTLTPRARWA